MKNVGQRVTKIILPILLFHLKSLPHKSSISVLDADLVVAKASNRIIKLIYSISYSTDTILSLIRSVIVKITPLVTVFLQNYPLIDLYGHICQVLWPLS